MKMRGWVGSEGLGLAKSCVRLVGWGSRDRGEGMVVWGWCPVLWHCWNDIMKQRVRNDESYPHSIRSRG